MRLVTSHDHWGAAQIRAAAFAIYWACNLSRDRGTTMVAAPIPLFSHNTPCWSSSSERSPHIMVYHTPPWFISPCCPKSYYNISESTAKIDGKVGSAPKAAGKTNRGRSTRYSVWVRNSYEGARTKNQSNISFPHSRLVSFASWSSCRKNKRTLLKA